MPYFVMKFEGITPKLQRLTKIIPVRKNIQAIRKNLAGLYPLNTQIIARKNTKITTIMLKKTADFIEIDKGTIVDKKQDIREIEISIR